MVLSTDNLNPPSGLFQVPQQPNLAGCGFARTTWDIGDAWKGNEFQVPANNTEKMLV